MDKEFLKSVLDELAAVERRVDALFRLFPGSGHHGQDIGMLKKRASILRSAVNDLKASAIIAGVDAEIINLEDLV